MSDVLKNIADAVDNNSTRRGFSDLFADSKAALDKLQAGLGGLLPSMPGMPVAKFGDKGSDIQLPGFQASVDYSRQEGKHVCRGNHEDENS